MMMIQECLAGLYRKAELSPDVVIHEFDLPASDFRRAVLRPLQLWKPHGVVVRMGELDLLRQVRDLLPGVPFVSTVAAPAELVDTVVAADAAEFITEARDHFHKWGVRQVALLCTAPLYQAQYLSGLFRKVVPDGAECLVAEAVPGAVSGPDTAAGRKRLKQVMTDWLAGLPKPVGILTLETGAAAFLLEHCRRLKLRVPREVQIIGIDSADHCLACEPRLSSLELPNRRIGEVALQTLLRWMQQEQPPPGPVIRVSGSHIVARGTTGPVEAGRAVLSSALEIMHERAAKGLTASQTARLSSVGRTTLYKEFAKATGVTPARYLRRQRLEHACRQLRETADPVKDIAERCGFNSPVAFIRFFRRHMDTTPTAYRQQTRRKS